MARSCMAIAMLLAAATAAAQDRVRTEIPYRDGTVVMVSDFQERAGESRYRARGRVEITFQDILITTEDAEYDGATRRGATRAPTRFSQGKQWLTASRAEFDFSNQTGVFHEASGFTDLEFLIQGRTIRRVARDRYVVDSGLLTACQEKRPKWSFSMARARIRVDHTARLSHTLFKIKGAPILYLPYVIVPLERKERSSGILPPHTGSSTSKGRVVTLGYFQTLGSSADVAIYGDYFTKRGLAVGGIFRARPRADTRLYLLAYGIRDREEQGGAHLIVDGESQLGNGFRAVANVNITSNFRFRQAFADTFRSATVPEERSILFLSRSHEGVSTNLSFQRQEVRYPGRSLVIRHAPSGELAADAIPLGKSPLTLSFRAAAEGVSRVDSRLESPSLVQRLDVHPRVTARLPSIGGFSLLPSAGFRETYYSARIETDGDAPRIVPRSLRRGYGELELDLRAPVLERTFQRWGGFTHTIEPLATYRWIRGVDRLDEIVRFDDHDAIADTSELEFGIVNRFFRSYEISPGVTTRQEFLSIRLMQKSYFDPDFGGALREGEPNVFFPLNTLTGFSLTGIQRRLSPASLAVRVTPASGISWDVRADYDPKLDAFRDASVSSVWSRERVFLAGTYFRTRALEPEAFESNHIQGQAGYGSPTRGFSASVTLSYNVQTSQLLNSHSRLNYVWDCCGVALEFQQFDLGLRAESRFSFSFTLKGIGSFGNLKRPETLF